MRKLFMILGFLLPMSCCMVSCSDDNEPVKTELTSDDLDALQGTWNLKKVVEFDLPGERVFRVLGNQIVVFQKLPTDVNFMEVDSYTFTVSGMTLTLTNDYSGKVGAVLEIISFSANEIKAKLTDKEYGYGTYTMILTKKQ